MLSPASDRSDFAPLWELDPGILFLNHGSFGACPRHVLQFQHDLRLRMERRPVAFLARECEHLLDDARVSLADFVGAEPDDLAFVPNATHGVNTVLRSLLLRPGDRLLTTNHAYNACRNALEFVARRAGAVVDVASLPFPVRSDDDLVHPILELVRPTTRLALLDHVTSPTALVLPIARLVRELQARGVDTLVDGAHAPGMLPLDLRSLGACWYTGNCHKWMCAPKGAAFLHTRRDKRSDTHPPVISHGDRCARTDRDAFRLEFDWTGTFDPTACLSVPEAIRFMGSLLPGGWPTLMARNRKLALHFRDTLCARLDVLPPAPDSLLGSMAAVPLPDDLRPAPDPAAPLDPVQELLLRRFSIEVPLIPLPDGPRAVRVSAQLYNAPSEAVRLADALVSLRSA